MMLRFSVLMYLVDIMWQVMLIFHVATNYKVGNL